MTERVAKLQSFGRYAVAVVVALLLLVPSFGFWKRWYPPLEERVDAFICDSVSTSAITGILETYWKVFDSLPRSSFLIDGADSLPGLRFCPELRSHVSRSFKFPELMALVLLGPDTAVGIYRSNKLLYELPKRPRGATKLAAISRSLHGGPSMIRQVVKGSPLAYSRSHPAEREGDFCTITVRKTVADTSLVVAMKPTVICFFYAGEESFSKFWANLVPVLLAFVLLLMVYTDERKEIREKGGKYSLANPPKPALDQYLPHLVLGFFFLGLVYACLAVAHLFFFPPWLGFLLHEFATGARKVLPDNAFFTMAGLALLFLRRHQKFMSNKRQIATILVVLVVLHMVLSLFPYHYLQRQGATPQLAELMPQVYACGALILVGLGLHRRGRYLLSLSPARQTLTFKWSVAVVGVLWWAWAVAQPFYAFRIELAENLQIDFFWAAFAIKSACFAATILYVHFERVGNHMQQASEREEETKKQEALAEMRKRELEHKAEQFRARFMTFVEQQDQCTLFLQNFSEIQAASLEARECLPLPETLPANPPLNILDILYGEAEHKFLLALQRGTPPTGRFLLRFKDKQGKPVILATRLLKHSTSSEEHWFSLEAMPMDVQLLNLAVRELDIHRVRSRVHGARVDFQRLEPLLNEKYKELERGSSSDDRYFLDQLGSTLAQLTQYSENADNYRRLSPDVLFNEGTASLFKVLEKVREQVKTYPFHVHISGCQEDLCVRFNEDLLLESIAELLTNSKKKFQKLGVELPHGTPQECHVELSTGDASVVLTVTDNGKGFEENTLRDFKEGKLRLGLGPRVGLAGIKVYAEWFGGSFTIENVTSNESTHPRQIITMVKMDI